jgi:PQQ-like domain
MDKARRRLAAWWTGGIVLLALAPPGLGAAQSEWPSLRGPNHDGSASLGSRGTAGSLAVRWRAKLGSGYSGVAIASGRAVTMFSDGRQDIAIAFDVSTGQEAWRIEIGPTLKGRDGSFDGPISTPAIADGHVFALGPRGQLVAVELASGRLLWRADLVAREGARQPDYGFASSPIVVNGVLVVEIGADKGRAVAGFDPATGARRWTAGDDAVQYQSPVMLRVGRRDLVIAMGDTHLFGIEPETGRLVFAYAHGGRADPIGGASAVPVPAGEGRLFVKTEAGRSTMLRVAESAEGSVIVHTMWTAPPSRDHPLERARRSGMADARLPRLGPLWPRDHARGGGPARGEPTVQRIPARERLPSGRRRGAGQVRMGELAQPHGSPVRSAVPADFL